MLTKIKSWFADDKLLYSEHARYEMEYEPKGEILEQEVYEAVNNGKIIERYDKDKPYPSVNSTVK